jgi:hypothetical protein
MPIDTVGSERLNEKAEPGTKRGEKGGIVDPTVLGEIRVSAYSQVVAIEREHSGMLGVRHEMFVFSDCSITALVHPARR